MKGEPLSQDDLTDLALLRLDLMAALETTSQGLPGKVFVGYLLPNNAQGEVWRLEEHRSIAGLTEDFLSFIQALEAELHKGVTALEIAGKERAILASVVQYGKSFPIEDSLEELGELARTAGLEVIDTVIQRPKRINPKYLMGEGRLKDLIIKGLQTGADVICFDQDLSPGQINAIAEQADLKVIDRTQLILDIFARRAHSRDGKVRVELAQLKYLLPRLTGKGIAMSRLMGGIGGRGPGETKLETDRRRIKDRIHRLEKELDHLGKGGWQRRTKRRKQGLPICSIVGYTNTGKSTLLNALTESTVAVEDRLFATLDTASRRLRFPREREVIITDTVGFIRDLPPDLLGAFRSTLEELADAGLLLHVIDISNPRFEDQMAAVEALLVELDLTQISVLRIFNKKDRVEPAFARLICRRFGGVAISALDRSTFSPLLTEIEELIWGRRGEAEALPLFVEHEKG
ncbi:MAG: GTPase HflX [Deltaproteobacteria bacterium]|nr:GTPase HflX [Deltaproteobacteria bacterium]